MSPRVWFGWSALVLLVVAAGCARTRTPDEAEIAANNRGVGLMGRFEYEAARIVFEDLVAEHPDWLEVKINLAIATLNRQQEGDSDRALQLMGEVLADDPRNLRALYCSGVLHLYLGRPDEALAGFRQVAEADPQDAYAAYYIAQCRAQQSSHDEALTWYGRALDADPYLRSAAYGAAQSLLRLGRRDEAQRMLDQFERLKDNPWV